jgi:hypothetical protein
VLGAVDDAHPSAADRLEDPVRADPFGERLAGWNAHALELSKERERAYPRLMIWRCLLFVALAGCRAQGALCVAVSVDWEGASLEEADLSALERLERELPGVPLTHFANAAYFTKPGADPARVRAAMNRVIREGDEVGLHVHPWHHLVEAAGVEPRFEPSFLGQRDSEIDGESGYDIELEGYEQAADRGSAAGILHCLRRTPDPGAAGCRWWSPSAR